MKDRAINNVQNCDSYINHHKPRDSINLLVSLQRRNNVSCEVQTNLKSSLEFWMKDRAMDNDQSCDSYINMQWSQTYRFHVLLHLKPFC
jgi:hypothetical protein